MDHLPVTVSRQNYSIFEGAHPDRSSRVLVSEDSSAVLKSRPEQREDKFMREFLALHVWSRLLEYYNQEVGGEYNIESPKPIAVNFEEKSIYMSRLPGETITRTYAMAQSELGVLAVRDLIANSAYRLGRLFSIKRHEQLKHGDFKTRHLLVGRTAVLSVIDVESTSLGEPDEVEREHGELYGRVADGAPGWKQAVFRSGFLEGRAGFQSREAVVKDIISSINLGERPEFNLALYERGDR
jgi:tRNA A-37 threonylcarbamoyl transferase component Bud32